MNRSGIPSFLAPLVAGISLLFGAGGCGGDARVELAAADAIDAAAAQLKVTLDEYTAELELADRRRRDGAVAAFVERLRRDIADDPATRAHAAAFSEALAALDQDRTTEQRRHNAASANVGTLEEIAAGLRRVAISTLTIRDEIRRYLDSLVQARRTADTTLENQS